MKRFQELLDRIINPRARYGKLPSFRDSVEEAGEGESLGGVPHSGIRLKDILSDIPLMIGLVIVLGLFILVLFGPVWAPRNPYISGQHIVPRLDFETMEYIRPPLLPSEEFPLGTNQWGTDILSMLMHGARNTLILCAFITLVRVVLGLALGAWAGWNEGKNIDKLLMGLMGMITSLPLLISSMILIFVLDIRGGLSVFIIALSVLGWSEIAQYIRGEFLVLRKAPYIEGAQASGLNGLQIAVRHVVPNVLPQLMVIAFLEMGAVLMLLGELGFLGVYIGGGARIDLSEPMAPPNIVTLIEVPEWGAMIADGFRWMYNKPHVVFPPAMAFFVSVLGFNALGEGFRRLIDSRSLNTAFLLKKRMLVIVGAVTMATIFILNNTGAGPWYTKVAADFDADLAYAHIETLAEMDGRGIGQPGGDQAASYIAERFEAYGLEPGWRKSSYINELNTTIVRAVEQPQLTILDRDDNQVASYQHQVDFGYMIEGHAGSGQAAAGVTFVGFDTERGNFDWEAFKDLDLRGQIILLYRDNAPVNFTTEAMIRGARGVLWVTGDGRDDVRSQIQFAHDHMQYVQSPSLPVFRIRPHIAAELLTQAGYSISELFNADRPVGQSGPGWFTRPLDVQVSMSVELGQPEQIAVPGVMGYLPGTDFDLAGELLILYVNYDGLGLDADGSVYPGVNHSAAGVGLMLEIAQLWQKQELAPRRTVLFMAWGGNSLDETGVRELLEEDLNFRHLRTESLSRNTRPSILIQLDYIGSGGESLLLHPDSSEQLINLFLETNSEDTGLSIAVEQDTPEFDSDIITKRMRAWLSLKWELGDYSPLEDSLNRLDREKLEEFGRLFALVLTKLVRETEY
ncbi:MAG: ABC transporter permease subunit [Anaerolineae bacterium]|nr:ABC transporter permease subunit [Anaerolineae bacterium]